jgi:hypothetical protein
MKTILFYSAFLLLICCTKPTDHYIKTIPQKLDATDYTKYVIKKGEHYSNLSTYKAIEITALNFIVKFDNSAIYTSKEKINQHDINKLYGFSDNNAHHHEYSARFGWSFINDALHLYAYVYNEGKRNITDLGTIAINTEKECSIKVSGTKYVFTVDDKSTSIERSSKTTKAKGYMLYPYFGGDETAPHDVHIAIKNL